MANEQISHLQLLRIELVATLLGGSSMEWPLLTFALALFTYFMASFHTPGTPSVTVACSPSTLVADL